MAKITLEVSEELAEPLEEIGDRQIAHLNSPLQFLWLFNWI